MNRVLLYNPKSAPAAKAVMPLSLLALRAVLEGRVQYQIVDGNLIDDALGGLDALIRRDGIGTLGMTVMPGPQLEQAVPITRDLKRRHPGLNVIWGGYFPTLHPEVVLKSGIVDYVVRGHNDSSIARLFEAVDRGDSVADFANGPREWNLQYPEIVDRLLDMGSSFADDCKAAQCVQKTRPARDPGGNNRD